MPNIHPKASCRIAFITGLGYYPHWCGIAESLYQLISTIHYDVLTITSGTNTLYQKLTDEGKKVIHTDFSIGLFTHLKKRKKLEIVKFLLEVLKFDVKLCILLKKNNIKIAYISDPFALSLSFLPCIILRIKMIVGIRGLFKNRMLLKMLFFAERVIFLSKEMRETVLGNVSRQTRYSRKIMKKSHVISNGIFLPRLEDLPERMVVRKSLPLAFSENSADLYLLYVGRFDDQKGQFDFISHVLPLFQPQADVVSINTIFVGAPRAVDDNEYFNSCQNAAGKLKGSRIHFAGFQKDIWKWYWASDIVVLGSKSEGQPRVILEAMAYARPVVAYDVTSMKEMLGGSKAGVIVPQSDANAMSNAIKDLSLDREKRESMGRRGRQFAVDTMDIYTIAKKYDDLFSELL